MLGVKEIGLRLDWIRIQKNGIGFISDEHQNDYADEVLALNIYEDMEKFYINMLINYEV